MDFYESSVTSGVFSISVERDIEGNHCSKKYNQPHQAKKEKKT